MILCSSAFAILTKNVKALPQNINADTTPQTSANPTASTPLSPPTIGGSSQIIKVNSPIIPMAPVSPANITSSSSNNWTNQLVSQEDQNVGANVTWDVTYWANSQNDMADMYPTFQVGPNTFGNLGDGYVYYEPVNIDFGTPGGGFVWYQFAVVYQGGEVEFLISAIDESSIGSYWTTIDDDIMPHIGDYYKCNFSAAMVGETPQVTFWIQDMNNPQDCWSTHSFNGITPPGISLVFNDQYYSPASCVETGDLDTGITVSNCPYVETTLNTNATGCYSGDKYFEQNTHPAGIETKVGSGSGNYYWSMLSQQYFYISSELNDAPYGDGHVSNPDALATNHPDGSYAHIYGENAGDGGNIVGQMSGVAGGNIYVYGRSDSAYPSDLWVFVSMDGSTWYQINSPIEVSSSDAQWIPIGYYADFEYLAVAGYNSQHGVSLYIGAVWASGDPSVTILAYDESTESYVDGIPIAVDGNWVTSGNTVDLIDPNPLFYAPDSDGGGAFNCFFDGSNYYGNSANIPITGNETITAYYNYLPTYTLTINAYDPYFHEPTDTNIYVDGNYVGTASATVQVPIGDHTVTFDYSAYNEGWNDYGTILEIDGNYCGYYEIYSQEPVILSLFVTYDTQINAVYSIN